MRDRRRSRSPDLNDRRRNSSWRSDDRDNSRTRYHRAEQRDSERRTHRRYERERYRDKFQENPTRGRKRDHERYKPQIHRKSRNSGNVHDEERPETAKESQGHEVKIKKTTTHVERKKNSEVDESSELMMQQMGFSGFSTTKDQKKPPDADVWAVDAVKKRKFRQYMNTKRQGVSNRPNEDE